MTSIPPDRLHGAHVKRIEANPAPNITGKRMIISASSIMSDTSMVMSMALFLISKPAMSRAMPANVTAVKIRSKTVHMSRARAPDSDALPQVISMSALHRLSVVAATFKAVSTHTPVCLSSENTMRDE